MVQAAHRCVSLDASNPFAQLALGMAYAQTGPPDRAIAALERSIQLNPSLPWAYSYLSMALVGGGRPEEAIAHIERARRLSPLDPVPSGFHALAMAHFALHRYEEAVALEQRELQLMPDHHFAHRILAASYAHLGRLDEARAAFEEVLRRTPSLTMAGLKLLLSPEDPDYTDHYIDGLRKAGLKD